MLSNYKVETEAKDKRDATSSSELRSYVQAGRRHGITRLGVLVIGFGVGCLSAYASSSTSSGFKPPSAGEQTTGASFLIAQGAEPDGPMFGRLRDRFRQGTPALERQPSMERPRGGMRFKRQFMGDAMPLDLSILNLTQEQKNKIQELRMRDSAKAREIRKTLKERRMQLRSLMFDPKVSDQEIKAKRKEMRKLMDQMEDVMLDDFLSIRTILTPEQRLRLPELKPGQRSAEMHGPESPPESGFEPAMKRPRWHESAENP